MHPDTISKMTIHTRMQKMEMTPHTLMRLQQHQLDRVQDMHLQMDDLQTRIRAQSEHLNELMRSTNEDNCFRKRNTKTPLIRFCEWISIVRSNLILFLLASKITMVALSMHLKGKIRSSCVYARERTDLTKVAIMAFFFFSATCCHRYLVCGIHTSSSE